MLYVFLDFTPNALSTQEYKWEPADEILGWWGREEEKGSAPSSGQYRNTPSHFRLWKLEISAGPVGHKARK